MAGEAFVAGGIAPGGRETSLRGVLVAIYDQGDFVPVIWAMLTPIWVIPPAQAALAFVDRSFDSIPKIRRPELLNR
jgi:hypothetical protein